MLGNKTEADKIYQLECYLDHDGTCGIPFLRLRNCWLAGLRTQNGIYGYIKSIKGEMLGFVRRVSVAFNKLLTDMIEDRFNQS